MCGITGFMGDGDSSVLKQMNSTLRHRGPDDAGVHIIGNVGLAQCRLSIIDLSSSGHQPMSNEDNTLWIVFNGEIYNFKTLREGLKQQHLFRGQSDTEVILHLYEEIGTEVFSKIHGMFALALYDSKKGQVILARDRMGKKPLYWGMFENTLIFGSELKALIKHPLFRKNINFSSLNKYFTYEHIPTPHTIFESTWKLEPGTFLIWDGHSLPKKTTFWKPTFMPKETSFTHSLSKLDESLSDAVSDRLISDVPLGIFLSGGLDSSTVAYYASKRSTSKIKTFSIGFKEASFDESVYAREVAEHLGTEHYEKILSVHDCISLIPKIAESLDEPIADASIVPTYLLSKFAREHVTVALGGDGGDELFYGYDTFIAHKFSRVYEKVPKLLRNLIKKAVFLLPVSFSNMSFDFKAKRFVGEFEGKAEYRDRRWFAPFDRCARAKLFSNGVWNKLKDHNEFEDIDEYIKQIDSRDFYDKLGFLYERMYMMDQVLVKVDRASMMNSLEVRAPFLDTRIVDLANHMPISFKFKRFIRKYILKLLMKDKLPRNIVYRKKKGFGMPVAEWIRGDMKPLVLKTLGKESLDHIEFLNPKYVDVLLQEHFSGKSDNSKKIWTILIFVLWWQRWME